MSDPFLQPLWKTKPVWALPLMATLLSIVGLQAVGLAYLPFVLLYGAIVLAFAFVRVH